MELLDNLNNLGEKIKNLNLDFGKAQEKFLDTTIGKITNTAIDLGIKSLLPDYIEDEVIEIKDTIFSEGLSEGVSKAVESAIEVGKTAIGVITGDFKNIEQAKEALKEGGLVEGISNSIDYVLDKLENSNIISENILNVIKGGKKLILNNLDNNIENEFSNELKSLNKIENYIDKWKDKYSEKDLKGLNNQYNKIKKEMEKILPLENIFDQVNKIENINELIKNSENFSFDKVYLDLVNNL